MYVLTDETQNSYILGLREMFDKSGHNTLDTFKEILNDINNHCFKKKKNRHAYKIQTIRKHT